MSIKMTVFWDVMPCQKFTDVTEVPAAFIITNFYKTIHGTTYQKTVIFRLVIITD